MKGAPFDENLRGEVIAQGLENIVFDFQDYVVKEVNIRSEVIFNIPGLTWFLSSVAHLIHLQQDHTMLKKILEDQLVDTLFVRGHSREKGTATNYLVQPYINGKPLAEYLADPDISRFVLAQAFFCRNRRGLLETYWKARKVFVLYGIPMDLTFNNILVKERPTHTSDKLLVIDPGFITEAKLLFFENYLPNLVSIETRYRFLQVCLNRIAQLEEVFAHVDASTFELAQTATLHGTFDVTTYESHKQKLVKQLSTFEKSLQV